MFALLLLDNAHSVDKKNLSWLMLVLEAISSRKDDNIFIAVLLLVVSKR